MYTIGNGYQKKIILGRTSKRGLLKIKAVCEDKVAMFKEDGLVPWPALSESWKKDLVLVDAQLEKISGPSSKG